MALYAQDRLVLLSNGFGLPCSMALYAQDRLVLLNNAPCLAIWLSMLRMGLAWPSFPAMVVEISALFSTRPLVRLILQQL